MKRFAGFLFVSIVILSCLAAGTDTRNTRYSQTRASSKADRKQQKAMKKYAKAQRKAQRKMVKKDRKNTHLPPRQF